MDMRVVLFLTLFTGMCVAHSKVNLAREPKATVAQSSTYPYFTNLVPDAQKAVDGNWNSIMSVGSCTHTDWEKGPWWRVDLGEAYGVSRVRITNRGDCCGERIYGAQIRVGNSLDNNGNNNELAATVESMKYGETKPFDFSPINGRYVNIVIPGRNEFLTLCEVEVFAG